MSKLLGEVNRRIRELAERCGSEVGRKDVSSWEFVCECGEEGCTGRVGLPLARYDELKNADGALFAPGHGLRRSA